MKKNERIARYGKEAYAKMLSQRRERYKRNYEREKVVTRKWRLKNPEKVIAQTQSQCCKGGKGYKQHMHYRQTGIPWEREKIRMRHGHQWRSFKHIISPESQIHHEWVPSTSNYTGVALVEKDRHMHGIIDVIEILDGKITLLTEKEIRER